MSAWPGYSGKPPQTWHELDFEYHVNYTCENSNEVNLDIRFSIPSWKWKTKNERYFIFQFFMKIKNEWRAFEQNSI